MFAIFRAPRGRKIRGGSWNSRPIHGSGTCAAGGHAVAPAHMNHFAWTKTGATMGPFELRYVNPADDPRGAKAK